MTSSSPESDLRTRQARGTSVEADLGWALGVVFRRYAKRSAEALEDLPGGPRGYQVLATAVGEAKRQLDLAAQLGVDRTVMTYLLDDLEKAGLVERRPDPSDRRARLIAATEKGREALCDLERRLQLAEQEILGSLEEGERMIFRDLLARLAVKADAVEHTPNACSIAEELDI